MQVIRRSLINIRSGRQRQDFDEAALAALAESIRRVGLINPVVVENKPDGTYLLAGERRLRALELLGFTNDSYRFGNTTIPSQYVPTLAVEDLSDLEREELELEENIAREDLSWQERVAAIARLDSLRKRQSPGHTTADTALEVFPDFSDAAAAVATTQRAILLAKAAKSDPEIANAKSEKEAYKLLSRKEERARFERLAIDSSKLQTGSRHTLVQEDCIEWMKKQPDGAFNIILTDPPYGMNAQDFGDAAGKLSGIEHHYDDTANSTEALLAKWFPEAFRITAPDAFLFLWCDIDLFPTLRTQAQLAGWKTHRTPFINIKREGGRVPWPAQGPRRCYELCLYAVKGSLASRGIVRDVFESTLTEQNYGHGAQKPVEAYEYLLRFVATPADIVLDTFAGTGTIIEAAERVGIRSVAVELDSAHYGIMTERLRALEEKNGSTDK